ncbi:hypothetical protein Q1J52_19010 [Pseudomonas lijiangensis]|uniref:hypothetical protein n=1 Tax=Pseudomonas lijiangensis TaxID=2995658 RepID=UPI0034D54A9D
MARLTDHPISNGQYSSSIGQEAKERSSLTREALADVDAGRVIDHEEVQAWADSLNIETPMPGQAN